MHCKGIDLTHPEGILARAIVGRNAGELLPFNQAPSDPWRTESVLDGRMTFGENLRQKILIKALGTQIPDVEQAYVKPLLEHEQKTVSDKVFRQEVPNDLWVAVAFPYQAPPLMRNGFHHLFDRRDLVGHPKQNRSAVEAPIALALDCVARSKVPFEAGLPTRVLLLTGADPWLELTAAKLTVQSKTLRIEIVDHAAVNPMDIKASLRHFGRTNACTRLFHAGNERDARRIQEALATKSGACVPEDAGEQAVAIGAIRHGGLIEGQLWGGEINQLDIALRIAPVSVGVLGTNKLGEWFWRRIFDKGTALPPRHTPSGLNFDASQPDRIALAECPHPEYAARRWLNQDQWADAGLRWHDVIIDDQELDDWDLQLMLGSIKAHWNPNSRCCPRWRINSRA